MPQETPQRSTGLSKRTAGFIWIDLIVHHPDCDPWDLTNEFQIVPWFAARSGTVVGPITRSNTVWMAHLVQPALGTEAFADALQMVVDVLSLHQEYLQRLCGQGGDVLLTINHSIGFDGGILSDITLEPLFLAQIARCEVALQILGWSANDWPDASA
jgi:hypothetical protein